MQFIGSKHVKNPQILHFKKKIPFFLHFSIQKIPKKKLSPKILYFITGDYAQIPKEFISENRLFLSCLVFEVKHFFKPLPGGVLRGWGVNGGSIKNFPSIKICALGKMQLYGIFKISIFNNKFFS